MSPALELFHWEPNGCFLKPLIALAEVGVPFTSRWFDPTQFEQFAPDFPRNTESTLQLEREGPVLVHGRAIVSNSFFMLLYIAESFPAAGLCGSDAFQHYRTLASGQVLTGLGADVSIIGCARYLAPVLKSQDPQALQRRLRMIEPLERRLAWSAVVDGTAGGQVARARERLRFPLGRVEQALSRTAWLAGPLYSVADIDAFAMLWSLPELAPELVNGQDTPHIVDFLHRMHERRAVREALALSRSGKPHEAFVPGAEPSRWG